MEIGIIGIGTLTLELARRAAAAGFRVVINNPRGNSLVHDAVLKMSSNIHLGSLDEAAAADIILLFIPKENLETVLKNLPDMTGKIIVHTSCLIFNPHTLLSSISNALTYQITASLLPSAHVIKLFNPVRLEAAILNQYEKRDEIYFIADHAQSKDSLKMFLKKLNFQPIDLSGRLRLHRSVINLEARINPN
ncbi:NAD(P)-binding domain-containing protein [Flavobacterium hungaricum]|uniref:Pyrroline-5-carboxylate reductase catalytic N-terminal domain-containing protein n=1 Tax=Flavobacterium hungaricum TaxID=2082725 RepID=A0ABR9TKR8_9FLAO|nr:NAD(P)-binding domain-containing protein [Flavobacterium hungaricum]MBE8725948.1 hypothetical protein [Flavobacterium hungaricum]